MSCESRDSQLTTQAKRVINKSYPNQESNLDRRFRRPMFYPLNYWGVLGDEENRGNLPHLLEYQLLTFCFPVSLTNLINSRRIEFLLVHRDIITSLFKERYHEVDVVINILLDEPFRCSKRAERVNIFIR